MTITSIVPFTLTETLTFAAPGGSPSRTIVNAQSNAGLFTDVFNGKTSSGTPLPDGVYPYTATVNDGAGHSMTTTVSSSTTGGWTGYPTLSSFDIFNNQPLAVAYGTTPAGLPVTVMFSPTDNWPDCNPPRYCLVSNEYGGPTRTAYWAGVDDTGVLRPDLKYVAKGWLPGATQYYTASAVFGGKPTIANLALSPPIFSPAAGSQNVAFDLSTYQNTAVTVTVSYLNQTSLSVLRTMTFTGQVPGHLTLPWDGRADNGTFVSPGTYTVTITITDLAGNVVRRRMIATVEY